MLDAVHASRYRNQTSTLNARALMEIMSQIANVRVILFVSDGDEPHPTMRALASYSIAHHGLVHVVFDGDFLSGESRLGLQYMRDALDMGMRSARTCLCTVPIAQTHELPPMEAAQILLDAALDHSTPLNLISRGQLRGALSCDAAKHSGPFDRRRTAGASRGFDSMNMER